MTTKLEEAVFGMKADLHHVKNTTDDIKRAVFGNGSRGLKTRVTILEVTMAIMSAGLIIAIGCLIKKYIFGE
ncbi:MAG TPA: hypothetical protein VMY59_04645 [Candidatus Thermoplasmatota archaeon]|nr:hypothetical protein [Candidatus Thermoplasmatota archaeon]